MCELIVGRWYDFRQEGNEDEIAGKWEGTIHNEYFYMTAGLRKRGGYYKITKGSWWMPKKIKELSKEELKKLLPKDAFLTEFPLPEYEIF